MAGSWRVFLLCCVLQGGNAGKFGIVTPKRVMTFSGTCVTVPCSFTVEDNYKVFLNDECKPIWRRDEIGGSHVPTEARTGGLSATFEGNLTAFDCTTTFKNVQKNNGQYYFRLECSNQTFRYTFAEAVTIQTKGVPAAPSLTPVKKLMVEGTPVELGCSALSFGNINPTVTWTPTLGRSTELQQNDAKSSTLIFTASHRHHGNNVSCTATYFIPSCNRTVMSTSSFQLNVLSLPRILPSSGCSRKAAWVLCYCDSTGKPSPALVFQLDGKLILDFEDVSIDHFNLDNFTLRSTLIMRPLAGHKVLACYSFNTAGNTSLELSVPLLDIQHNLTDLLPCIVKSVVIFVGLVCLAVCTIRSRKMHKEKQPCNNATMKKGSQNEVVSQVSIRSEEDYVNCSMQMNAFRPREEAVLGWSSSHGAP